MVYVPGRVRRRARALRRRLQRLGCVAPRRTLRAPARTTDVVSVRTASSPSRTCRLGFFRTPRARSYRYRRYDVWLLCCNTSLQYYATRSHTHIIILLKNASYVYACSPRRIYVPRYYLIIQFHYYIVFHYYVLRLGMKIFSRKTRLFSFVRLWFRPRVRTLRMYRV